MTALVPDDLTIDLAPSTLLPDEFWNARPALGRRLSGADVHRLVP